MTFFLHENLYRDLTPAADRLITICGAGALGANLAETLARMGLHRLRAIDRDRVAAHNLSTQPWMQQDVGASKARVLAAALYRAVGARVEPQQIELTPANAESLLSGSAVVVDAFDNLPARRAVAGAATALGIPCLHIALAGAGDYGCGLWDDAYTPIKNQEPRTENQVSLPVLGSRFSVLDGCDYPLTRPLALLVAAAAAEVLVDHLLGGGRRGFEVTLRDLRLALA
jgi:molybdopterin-synthase adenylyltransferase